MTPVTKKLLADFQIRKTKQQKASFRAWLCDELWRAGYAPQMETGGLLNSSNVVAGDPGRPRSCSPPHYDTCAVLPFPNFITPQEFPGLSPVPAPHLRAVPPHRHRHGGGGAPGF